MCMAKAYQTEHSRLLIVPIDSTASSMIRVPVIPQNIDMFTYVNSKFVYTERHIRKQMTSLYHDILRQKCELERDVLLTQLSLAHIAPTEFAYLYTKEPGYTANVMGEVISLIKCQAVETEIRPVSDQCYHELPITYLGRKAFMTPKNHLIQYVGTEISCSGLSAPGYFIQNQWYGLSPNLHSIPTPYELSPSHRGNWTYLEPASLA